MSAELDMTQYLGLFLQEADEQLEILEQETLKLEDDPTMDRLNTIFRAAHTLKGSSRAMSFDTFASVTHEMENLLDALRAGKIKVNTKIADTLLRCQDSLRTIRASIAEGNGDKADVEALVAEVIALQGEQSDEEETVSVANELPLDVVKALNECTGEAPVYKAKFVLHPDCVMKYVRAFMAINVVHDGGELLATIPDPNALEQEQFDFEFELYFQHKESVATLKTRFEGIGEVNSFEVETYKTARPASEIQLKVEESNLEPVHAPKKVEASQTVRVDVSRLDELMNLVGELVIDRTRIAQIGSILSSKYTSDESIEALGETVGHISRITSDLQDQLMKARMLPIETVLNRFPRMVRDLAQKIGKEVKLELNGGETELDRSVIEAIGDPLIHILRNSIDHGLEAPGDREKLGKPRIGQVTINAKHQENHIVIEIIDDGRGIDVSKVKQKAVSNGHLSQEAADRMTEKEALNLIFLSGVSTAKEITEVSGRGVGMDIVRSNVQKLGGLIDVETTVGVGSKVTLRLPLTLAIIRGLLVKVCEVVYVIPLGAVVETLLVTNDQIQSVAGQEVIVIRGSTTPLVRLRETFGRNIAPDNEPTSHYVVIVGLAEQRAGLVVDSLVGEQEVVIKSLNRFCGEIRGISGATILGNGNVALILDVSGVLQEATA